MRVIIPEFKSQKLLFSYLKNNRKQIITQKCSSQIKSDDGDNEPFEYGCLEIKASDLTKIGKGVKKKITEKAELGEGEVQVDAIANMAGWCDSYMDVLIPDCWSKTIKEKGASDKHLIYHLKNHVYSTDAVIGADVVMRSEYIDLAVFNIDSELSQGQALIGSSIVKKKYDPKCYYLYMDDEVKQHSIGLRYLKMALCMNSEEEEYQYEKENWDKYLEFVINKDKVEKSGFFWAVTEIKLLEYSAVLFGANELTTVTETSKIEPLKGIQKESSEDASLSKTKKYLLMLNP